MVYGISSIWYMVYIQYVVYGIRYILYIVGKGEGDEMFKIWFSSSHGILDRSIDPPSHSVG